jgi:hypothetical protein
MPIELLEILGIASMGVILVRNFLWRLKIKPFTCEMCMAFWLGIAYFWQYDELIPYCFLSAAVAVVINRYL